ncbi:MAG: adenylate cyclase [Bacteroidetes bacterium GWF2_41_31]|nr:MAG: adenylate cyclase [Bacteroidetes bacterium GWF2_41_31]
MPQEIEKKFLVTGNYKPHATHTIRIIQGYLVSVPERTVRIRIAGNKGFITIKGQPGMSGLSRYEWEKEIPLKEANELLELCEPGVIDKTRHLVPEPGGLTFEVDEFYGDNQGLIVAEIELPSEDTPFEKPSWLGEEVTGDLRYFNSMLIKNPFKNW